MSPEEESRAKAYAVAVLAEVWAGADLPPSMIDHAEKIRRDMIHAGTWVGA